MLTLLYSDKVSGPVIHETARAYGKRRLPSVVAPHSNVRDPHRQLRIGFVSGDFRRHVVGLFLLPLFMNRNRAAAQFYCYSMVDVHDPFTQHIASHADRWIDCRALSDAQLAARIREDVIDILIDLSGHTGDNRLEMFSRCPAPVQATWLGFPGTTGAPGIHYRLTDNILDPPGSESHSTEIPVRLETGFFCYRPLPEWGAELQVRPLPALQNGHVTFGSFNNLAKVSPMCLDSWAEILRKVPGSILMSRAKPFDRSSERERFAQHFIKRGIDADRIRALPYLPDPVRHLEIYHEVDIHLDSYPYTGGTTNCDSLWMGVPAITLAGDRPSARLGATVLGHMGLESLVAVDNSDYVRMAVELAGQPSRMKDLRQGMRTRFIKSSLYDDTSFSQAFHRACRTMWHAWCS